MTTAELTPLRRNLRFQLLWIGATASALGSHTSALAFPLLVLAITGSPAKAGLVSAATLVGTIMMAIPAGPLVDRWDRRRILIGCESARALTVASVAVAAFTGQVTLAHLLAVAVIQGAVSALFGPSRIIAVRGVVPPQQLRSALGQEEVRTYGAALVGPPIGGALFALGRAVPFAVDAVSYLVSLSCIIAARVPRRPVTAGKTAAPRPAGNMASQIAEGFRWLWGHRFARTVCGFSLALNVVVSGIMLPVIVLITGRGGSVQYVGFAMAAMGVGGLAGAALANRIGGLLPPGRLVLAFGWWFALLLPVTTLPFGALWPGVVLGLTVMVTPALNVTLQSTVLTQVPDEMLGRVGSMLMVASMSLAPLGPLLSGSITQAFGPVTALCVLGGALACVAAVATLVPTLRRPELGPQVEASVAEPAVPQRTALTDDPTIELSAIVLGRSRLYGVCVTQRRVVDASPAVLPSRTVLVGV